MQKYKIMIVDDEVEVREGIVNHIDWDTLGFEIAAEAENGRDALEKAENNPIDVVLTDIRMPFMDGLTMSTRLTQLYPWIKIIVLSGFDEFEYAKQAIKLNVVEYILKPINSTELTGILHNVRRQLDENIEQKRNIDALQKIYQKSLPLMRERFLNELLWGIIDEKTAADQMADFDPPINQAPYKIVVVFEAANPKKSASPVDASLIPFSIKQIVTEQLAKCCHHSVIASSLVVIAITAWDRPDMVEQLMRIASDICQSCTRVLELVVTAGIGRCYKNPVNIHDSFSEARTALEYKVLTGGGKAIYIHDMEHATDPFVAFDRQREEQLLASIKFGSADHIKKFIRGLFDNMVQLGTLEQQIYLFSLLSAIYRIIQRYNLNMAEQSKWQLQSFMQLPKDWNDAPMMMQRFVDICLWLNGALSAKRETATYNLAEETKRFIESNFKDSSLSVERVCEHLHVSPSYFSTVFKQETGSSYVQYLTEIRLSHAMRLLKETDDKTYMVAHQVGYEDPNYFSYVFKKHYGVSPTKYRNDTAI